MCEKKKSIKREEEGIIVEVNWDGTYVATVSLVYLEGAYVWN